MLGDADIDQATLELMANLRREPELRPMSPSALARRCDVTPAAISLRIRRAETAGWVRRESAEDDGRGVLVSLTPQGIGVAEELAEQVLRHDDELIAQLSAEELADLERLLRRLGESITAAPTTRPAESAHTGHPAYQGRACRA